MGDTFGHTLEANRRLLLQILQGTSDANIRFTDLCLLLKHTGFDERIRGSHHIFTRGGVEEILNLQPRGRWRSHTKCGKFEI